MQKFFFALTAVFSSCLNAADPVTSKALEADEILAPADAIEQNGDEDENSLWTLVKDNKMPLALIEGLGLITTIPFSIGAGKVCTSMGGYDVAKLVCYICTSGAALGGTLCIVGPPAVLGAAYLIRRYRNTPDAATPFNDP